MSICMGNKLKIFNNEKGILYIEMIPRWNNC